MDNAEKQKQITTEETNNEKKGEESNGVKGEMKGMEEVKERVD